MKYPKIERVHILHYPDKRLRDKAGAVNQVDSYLKELSERMAELMREAKGAGLASTQIGLPLRFVVVAGAAEGDKPEAFINPVILSREGKQFEEEGCLSVPGLWAKVRRAQKVTVRATRLNGEVVEMTAEGMRAKLWQHEIDHLDGGLFVDRVGPATKIMIAGRLRDMERDFMPEKEDDSSLLK